MQRVAVVLSGCGVQDGSEIHESVLTLLALDSAGAHYQCIAPNRAQHHVVNHATGEPDPSAKRNILEEAARIARGEIIALEDANLEDYDAVIFPGGFGAALNFSDFAITDEGYHVAEDVFAFARSAAKAGKPVGFLCISPILIPQIYEDNVRFTIGDDAEVAARITRQTGVHEVCGVDGVVVDEQFKVVSSPAYMLGPRIRDVAKGVNKLVAEILRISA